MMRMKDELITQLRSLMHKATSNNKKKNQDA